MRISPHTVSALLSVSLALFLCTPLLAQNREVRPRDVRRNVGGAKSAAYAEAYVDAYTEYWRDYYRSRALERADAEYVDVPGYGREPYVWRYDFDDDEYEGDLVDAPPDDITEMEEDYWDVEPWADPDTPDWFDGKNWAFGHYDYDSGYLESAYDDDQGLGGAPADYGVYRYQYFDSPRGSDFYDVGGYRDSYDREPYGGPYERSPADFGEPTPGAYGRGLRVRGAGNPPQPRYPYERW